MSTHLPPELWRLIFREATHVPDLLSTNWDHSPPDRLWDGWRCDVGSFEMSTRRSVVQVCRAWRDIGREYLFEAVHIPNLASETFNQVLKVVEVLTTSASNARLDRGHSLGHGWWVKRVSCPSSILASVHVEQLFLLLEHCHNLQIFIIRPIGDLDVPLWVHSRLTLLLESRFSHSLRRIELYSNWQARNANAGTTSPLPLISGVTSFGTVIRNYTPDIAYDHLFHDITTLTMDLPAYIDKIPSQWNFPALRNLGLQRVSKRDINALVEFIKRHQNTLLHLQIVTSTGTNALLPSLLSSAPQLHSLTLRDSNLGSMGRNTALPQLTHLGIICNDKGNAWELETGIGDILDGGLLPSLQVVRLLSLEAPLPHHIGWEDLSEACKDHGVRLEDRRGRALLSRDSKW